MAEPIDRARRGPRYWTGLSWGVTSPIWGSQWVRSLLPTQLSPKPGGEVSSLRDVSGKETRFGVRLT